MYPYHESQNEAPDTFADLRGDVGAKLLQGGEEPLQFAELTGPAGRGQLLRRGGVPHGRGRRGTTVQAAVWRMSSIQDWNQRTFRVI